MGSSKMGAGMKSGFVLFLALGITCATNENVFSRLVDDLFDDAGYDKDVIPMKKPADKTSNVNAINIALGVSVISMDLDPAGVLSASTWLRTTWSDFRLQWDPKEYQGLENIKIPASKVWRPDLSVYNAADFGSGSFTDLYSSGPANAIVYSSGKVLWIPPLPMKVYCNSEQVASGTDKNDPQECNIKMGSWTYDGFHLNLTAYDNEEYLELGDFSKNSPYVVTSQQGDALNAKYYDCCAEPYLSMNYKFTVQRAFTVQDGEKVFNKSPEDLEQLFEQYQTTFTGNK